MPPQSAENKLKILIAVLSQSATNENDFLPVPNYDKLAADLGLPTYASAQGVWRRLKDEIKRGDFGDLKIRDSETKSPVKKPAVVKEPKVQSRSPGKKRVAEESNDTVNDSESSPTKRTKNTFTKCGQGKANQKVGKTKVSKESNGGAIKLEAAGWMGEQQMNTSPGSDSNNDA